MHSSLFRIPAERAAQANADAYQAARRGAAVLAFHVGNRRLPFPDAIEEVAHVVDDGVKFVRSLRPLRVVKLIERKLFARQRSIPQRLDGGAFQRAAIDEQPAGVALGPRRRSASRAAAVDDNHPAPTAPPDAARKWRRSIGMAKSFRKRR